MTRPPRDLAPVLAAFYQHQNPLRPEKRAPFNEEVLAVAGWVLAQFEMIWKASGQEGVMPIVFPPKAAEGAEAGLPHYRCIDSLQHL